MQVICAVPIGERYSAWSWWESDRSSGYYNLVLNLFQNNILILANAVDLKTGMYEFMVHQERLHVI